jgi:ATP-dependent Clp endopeptidase proteolytic subunit ClpP
MEFFKLTNKADTLEIDIEGEIGVAYDWWTDTKGTTKEEVSKKLKEIANSTASKIIVNINSYGGDINHGISIHDALASHKAHVTTKVNGMTASAATVIAMAGDRREMSSNALFLVHKASILAYGNTNDIEVAMSDLEKVDNTIAAIYAKRTGKSESEVMEMMNRFEGRGEWLTAEEAKEFGFIDEIIEPMKAAAFASPETLNKIGLPEIPTNKIFNMTTKETVKAWFNEFMAAFKKPEEQEKPVDLLNEKEVTDKLEALASQVDEKDTLIGEKDTEIANLKTQVSDLTGKVTTLEDQIAKAKGTPTITDPKDDPIIEKTSQISNEKANEENAKSLRS